MEYFPANNLTVQKQGEKSILYFLLKICLKTESVLEEKFYKTKAFIILISLSHEYINRWFSVNGDAQ